MFFRKSNNDDKENDKPQRPEKAPKAVGIEDVEDKETLGQYLKNLMWAENSRSNN